MSLSPCEVGDRKPDLKSLPDSVGHLCELFQAGPALMLVSANVVIEVRLIPKNHNCLDLINAGRDFVEAFI